RPAVIKQLWDVEFFDFASFLVAFWVTIFSNIELAIYTSVGFSLLVLLYRIARPKVQVLVREEQGGWVDYHEVSEQRKAVEMTPYPGIVVFRVEEAFTYPNASHLVDTINSWIHQHTEFGGTDGGKDTLWCADGPQKAMDVTDAFAVTKSADTAKANLKAIVLDFSAVNQLDATGLQTLIDIRADAQAFAGHAVPFYFAHAKTAVLANIEYFISLQEPKELTPFPHNASNPVPECNSTDSSATESECHSKFLYTTIDDAVDAASRPFQFGNFSASTII
ncbi:hypothetical protein HDU91_007246, partial [Kappamyces sp. JEL0680]